jgi:hypothetical protein
LCLVAYALRHLAWLCSRNSPPPSPAGQSSHSFARNSGWSSPAYPQSWLGTTRPSIICAPRTAHRLLKVTARTRGSGLCLRLETAVLVMHASVRPFRQWRTDLFSPLSPHTFCGCDGEQSRGHNQHSSCVFRKVIGDEERAAVNGQLTMQPPPAGRWPRAAALQSPKARS